MKGNRRIKIIIIIFVLVNVFLLASALILSSMRNSKVDYILYDAITSEQFTKFASEGEYEDFDEYIETFDYEESTSSDLESNIDHFHDIFFEAGVKWSDIVSISSSLGGDLINMFAMPEYIAKLVNLEYGSNEFNFGNDEEGERGIDIEISIVAPNGIQNGMQVWGTLMYKGKQIHIDIFNTLNSDVANAALLALPANQRKAVKLLTNKILNSFIYKGVDLFKYNEQFYANGNLVDLSDGLDSEGVEINNILKMTDEEAIDFSNNLVVSLQLRDKGNEWFNYSTSQYLYSFGGNELFVWNNFMDYLTKNHNKNFRYENYNLELVDIGKLKPNYVDTVQPSTKLKWNLKNEKVLRMEKLDSAWEQFLWTVYNEIDYSSYLDRALKDDGKEYYSITDYYNNGAESEYIFSDDFAEMNSEITDVLWSYGDDSTSFSNFVIIANLYRPFIRTDNIDHFLKEISKIAATGLSPTDLLKPGKI